MLVKLSELLARYTSPFIILTAVVALLCPELFAWVQKGQTSTIILGIIMLTMGCTLRLEDFSILLRRPWDICIGSLAQFSIMPLVAFSLSYVFNLNPFLSAGIIMVGCCPGGVSSNLMSYLCKGDVAYSVGMTTVSTLLAPVLTPLLMLWLAGTVIEIDAWGMFKNILIITLLPVTIGCAFNYFLGHTSYFRQCQQLMPGLSVLCLACIVGGVTYQVYPQLIQNGVTLIALTLCVVVCHNGLGYMLGFIVARLFNFNTAKSRTLSIEVGMQNAGMATVLSSRFLASPAQLVINPLAAVAVVPCALSCIYHSISGTLLAALFMWWEKKKKI